ncbi:MAG: hypothetical protein LBP51_00435 [Deferribacteraceae bacterium]|jgi:hypothetical protein|nr:hypothetical protein [Deferribacteraceae bacterium]
MLALVSAAFIFAGLAFLTYRILRGLDGLDFEVERQDGGGKVVLFWLVWGVKAVLLILTMMSLSVLIYLAVFLNGVNPFPTIICCAVVAFLLSSKIKVKSKSNKEVDDFIEDIIKQTNKPEE